MTWLSRKAANLNGVFSVTSANQAVGNKMINARRLMWMGKLCRSLWGLCVFQGASALLSSRLEQSNVFQAGPLPYRILSKPSPLLCFKQNRTLDMAGVREHVKNASLTHLIRRHVREILNQCCRIT